MDYTSWIERLELATNFLREFQEGRTPLDPHSSEEVTFEDVAEEIEDISAEMFNEKS